MVLYLKFRYQFVEIVGQKKKDIFATALGPSHKLKEESKN